MNKSKLKLTQLYTSENQKVRFKTFVNNHFSGRMNSMSTLTWQLIELLISLEDELDFDRIHDETSFKREFITAIENHPEKRDLINFHIKEDD